MSRRGGAPLRPSRFRRESGARSASAVGALRTILVPHDFSPHSEAAWVRAERLAEATGARLYLLHVVHAPFLHALTPLGVVPFSIPSVAIEGALVSAEERLHQIADRSEQKVEVQVIEGPPTYWIPAVAERIHADLIVMGTHGRRGLVRALLGSVAERTLRRAPCPVLTVRAEKRARAFDA